MLALDDGRGDERAFEVVNRVSEINQGLYNTFALAGRESAVERGRGAIARDLNPARMERWVFSDLNPWMWWVKAAAEAVRANRQPVAPDNPFVQAEKKVSEQIEEALDRYRDARDDLPSACSRRCTNRPGSPPRWASSPATEPARRARRPGSARS